MRFSELELRIGRVLAKPPLERETVIRACGRLAKLINQGLYEKQMEEAGLSDAFSKGQIKEAAAMLSGQNLGERVTRELSATDGCMVMPLGVLLHIGAGNMEGLGAFSVMEGLMTGNVNLLKLPGNGDVISAFLLRELIRLEPGLKEYIYVFRISSSNQRAISKLLKLSDGVAVWGGDEAVAGIRRLAPPKVRLIEWGHRLSFTYVTREGSRDEEALVALARHMIETRQVLCSSCQGIYLEADVEESWRFCLHFRDLLEQVYSELGDQDASSLGRNTIEILHRELESACTGDRICRGRGVSVTLAAKRDPELSLMYGNCWVKQIRRDEVVETLRSGRGYLQTVVLICGEKEEQTVIPTLARSGATRIVRGKNPGSPVIPMTHDGEYPLSRYVKLVEIE